MMYGANEPNYDMEWDVENWNAFVDASHLC